MKPGFFKNEELSELSAMHRLLFAGLWLMADKSGRLEDRPRRIKGELFPYENADVEPMLADLAAGGFLFRYVVKEIPIIQIVNFAKHQRPHKSEPVSQLPECVDSQGDNEHSPSSPARFVRGLVTENGDGERGTGISAPKSTAPVREFLDWFQTEYKARRNGATYFVKWEAHGKNVKELLRVYPMDRLKKLAFLLLTTDEDWTTGTDRGIGILSTKINWLEERLCAWEAKTSRKQAANG